MATTIELNALRRVRLKTESSFAVDMTTAGTSYSGFSDIPLVETSMNLRLGIDMLPLDTTQQYVDGVEEKLVGLKNWSLTFTTPLAATGTVANASTTSVTSVVGAILTQAFGNESLSTGSAVASGGSTTGFVCTTNQGGRLLAGTAVALATGASSAWEMREVKTRSTDTITLKMALSATASSTVLRSATYYLTEPSANPTTLQFAVQGVEDSDRWILCGGRCTVSFGFAWGQVPTMQVTATGNYWLQASNDTAALTAASYTNYSPSHAQGGELHVATVGSTAQNLISPCHGFEIRVNTSWIPLRSPGGVQTEVGIRRGRNKPVVSGSFTTPFQDLTWYTARTGFEDRAVFLQVGNSITGARGTGGFLISVPCVQIVDVQRVDMNGVAGQQVTFEGRLDTDTTASGSARNDLEKSAIRFHNF